MANGRSEPLISIEAHRESWLAEMTDLREQILPESFEGVHSRDFIDVPSIVAQLLADLARLLVDCPREGTMKTLHQLVAHFGGRITRACSEVKNRTFTRDIEAALGGFSDRIAQEVRGLLSNAGGNGSSLPDEWYDNDVRAENVGEWLRITLSESVAALRQDIRPAGLDSHIHNQNIESFLICVTAVIQDAMRETQQLSGSGPALVPATRAIIEKHAIILREVTAEFAQSNTHAEAVMRQLDSAAATFDAPCLSSEYILSLLSASEEKANTPNAEVAPPTNDVVEDADPALQTLLEQHFACWPGHLEGAISGRHGRLNTLLQHNEEVLTALDNAHALVTMPIIQGMEADVRGLAAAIETSAEPLTLDEFLDRLTGIYETVVTRCIRAFTGQFTEPVLFRLLSELYEDRMRPLRKRMQASVISHWLKHRKQKI